MRFFSAFFSGDIVFFRDMDVCDNEIPVTAVNELNNEMPVTAVNELPALGILH